MVLDEEIVIYTVKRILMQGWLAVKQPEETRT